MNNVKKKIGTICRTWKKEGMRITAMLVAIAVFVTSIPGQAFVTKAEVRSDWEQVSASFGQIQAGTYGNGHFLVLDGKGKVYSSIDGINWEEVGNLNLSNASGVYVSKMTYCNEYFYVYGEVGKIYYSVDGSEWDSIDVEDKVINDITYAEGTYYALTGYAEIICDAMYSASGASLMSSRDGIHWDVLNADIPEMEYAGLVYGNGILVGVTRFSGHDTITMDLQGNILSDFERRYDRYENGRDVYFINGTFVLECMDGVYVSEDGTNWNQIYTERIMDGVVVGCDYYALVNESPGYYSSGSNKGQLLHFPNISTVYYGFNKLEAVAGTTLYNLYGGNNILLGEGYNSLWCRKYRRSVESEEMEKDENVSDNTVSNNTVSDNDAPIDDDYDKGWEILTEDMFITGDYEISGKNMDLNGHTLTVKGNLTCSDAYLKAADGKIVVEGNVVVEDRTQVQGSLQVKGDLLVNDSYLELVHSRITVCGNLEVSDASYNYGMKMTHEDDELIVNGNMVYQAPYGMTKSAGKITVSGDVNITGTKKSDIMFEW